MQFGTDKNNTQRRSLKTDCAFKFSMIYDNLLLQNMVIGGNTYV